MGATSGGLQIGTRVKTACGSWWGDWPRNVRGGDADDVAVAANKNRWAGWVLCTAEN